jgi:hypothetical protein
MTIIKNKQKITNVDEDVEKLRPLSNLCHKMEWFSYYGKTGCSLKFLKLNYYVIQQTISKYKFEINLDEISLTPIHLLKHYSTVAML